MSEIGYIKLHRKIIDWEWYDDINTKTLFIHILLMANFEDKKWHGEIIKRGSFITSLQSLSVQTGLSIQEVRTCLKKLVSTNDITSITNNKNTVIIVPNYDLYQGVQQAEQQAPNNQATNEQQSINKPSTTTKEIKKEKKDKNNKNIKHIYGVYKHVSLKDSEYECLVNDFGKEFADECIKHLDESIEMKGYKYKSCYLAIRRWVVGAVKDNGFTPKNERREEYEPIATVEDDISF